MQVVRAFLPQEVSQVGWSVKALLVAAEADNHSAGRLTGIGATVTRIGDIYTAMSLLAEDSALADMLVVDCDDLGGAAEVRRIVRLMGDGLARVPVLLISSDCQAQCFSEDRSEPTLLRAPLSAVSLRVAFEHVMQDRLRRPTY